MVYFFNSRMEFYSRVVINGQKPSRWAKLVPKFKEVELENRRPAESWDEEVAASERFIGKESWYSEVRQRELRIGSN